MLEAHAKSAPPRNVLQSVHLKAETAAKRIRQAVKSGTQLSDPQVLLCAAVQYLKISEAFGECFLALAVASET